jgi:hypothetical protein
MYSEEDENEGEVYKAKTFGTTHAGIGFFLILWGIASARDAMFTMHGLGFVLIGLIGVLTGALVYRK